MKQTFTGRVYEKLSKVPNGKVTTYKELALALNTRAYRAIGTALKKNPYAPKIPCHRVVNSNGSVGGFAHGPQEKIKLLKSEGIEIEDNRVKNFEKVLFRFKS